MRGLTTSFFVPYSGGKFYQILSTLNQVLNHLAKNPSYRAYEGFLVVRTGIEPVFHP